MFVSVTQVSSLAIRYTGLTGIMEGIMSDFKQMLFSVLDTYDKYKDHGETAYLF